MAAKDFTAKLEATLKNAAASPYADAVTAVKEVAQGIQAILPKAAARKKGAAVVVEPGFPSQLGQQVNVVLRISDHQVADTLFRVYITPDGRFNLDLYGEQPIACSSKSELESEILTFLARPEVMSRLNLYLDLLKS